MSPESPSRRCASMRRRRTESTTASTSDSATTCLPISPCDGRSSPPSTDRRSSTSSSPRTIRWPPACWPRGAMGYTDQSGSWVHDPDRSEALLDEAGWTERNDAGYRVKDGQVLALTVNIALPQPRSNEVQTLIQQQLRRVGVRLSINPGDQSKQTLDALDLDTVQIYHSMVARADFDNLRSNYSSVNRDVFLN